VVSSTRIREAIQQGELSEASKLLGRPYAISSRVLAGERLGRQLGFPTANLDVAGLVLPPNGVYAGYARINDQSFPAVANAGIRPTLNRPKSEPRLEVHVLDFSGELYGQELEFRFVQSLRAEEKFPSLQALRQQIGKDVRATRNVLASRTASAAAAGKDIPGS
jgi:riboflavin kinase/FMN adenylyltransferase